MFEITRATELKKTRLEFIRKFFYKKIYQNINICRTNFEMITKIEEDLILKIEEDLILKEKDK